MGDVAERLKERFGGFGATLGSEAELEEIWGAGLVEEGFTIFYNNICGLLMIMKSGHLGGIFLKVRDLLTVTKCIQAGGGDV